MLAALLFLDNDDNFDKESKVGSATTMTAKGGVKIGLTSGTRGARRGQGNDDGIKSNDGRYATLPPWGQRVQKEHTWKAG